MNATPSSITSTAGAPLGISTTAFGGTEGIVVGTGSTDGTQVSNVSITKMAGDGIRVNGSGVIKILGGVVANENGVAKVGNGLSVTGTGLAIIDPGTGAATTFNGNSAHGILVQQSGRIQLTGTPAGNSAGSVETNGNVLAGVWIQQTAGAIATATSTITGLVSFGNTAGNGLRIVEGSFVTVRGSIFLGNKGNGVNVSSTTTTGSPTSTLGQIDLGSTLTNGGNTFQAPLGSGNNAGAGICLDVAPNQGALQAVGNTFQAETCTGLTTATLALDTKGCGNSSAACPTGVCDLGFETLPQGTGNSFNVTTCTQ
jgi:hypothetical protein